MFWCFDSMYDNLHDEIAQRPGRRMISIIHITQYLNSFNHCEQASV